MATTSLLKVSLSVAFLLILASLVSFADGDATAPVLRNGPSANPFSVSKSSKKSEISMGTTLVALCCKGGVVVGADTRTSVSGYVSNRFAHKCTPLSDHIVVCRSGSAADTQRLCDEARWELQSMKYRYQRVLQVPQVANLLRSFMVEQDMQASLLCAGVDSNGEGQLYAILPSGALFQHDVYAVSGSGSTYITGYLDDQLANKDTLLNEQEAIDLVAKAIQLAMDRDGSSGGFVRIYSVTSNGRRSITIYPLQQETSENVKSVGSKNAPSSRDLPGFAPSVSGA